MIETSELETLRVSVARIAQALGLDLDIPGAGGRGALSFQDLATLARNEQRGWNALCAMIVDEITKESI